MPYRQGHWYVGLVLAVILAGFWASYWSPIGHVPVAFHVHALSSSAWLLLLIVQSLAIQRRANGLHRQLGLASFALFPLLMLGFMLIINVSAQNFVNEVNPFAVFLGPAVFVGLGVALVAYLTLFYMALKHRRTIALHAGYMLATPLILFESPFSRVIEQFLPWMNIIGSDGPRQVLDVIVISDGMAILFALALYARNRRHGAPWLVAAAFMAAQAVAMWFAPDLPAVGTALRAYAAIPLGLTASAGIAAGALAGWLGWRAGGGTRRPAQAAA